MRGVCRQSAATAAAGVRVVGWLAAVGLCLALLLAASGPVAASGTQSLGGNDTDPPEWGAAAKESPTEITVTFYDNSTIDRDSIAPGDFTLSAGNLTNVTVEGTSDDGRTGVRATLILAERLNVENVTVGLTGTVADSEGNELTGGSDTVTGMDTLVPRFERFSLTRVNESTVDVRLAASEPLSGLELAVTGPVEDRLTVANFTAVDAADTTFTTRYTVPEPGAYSFVWERAVDRRGNFRTMERLRQFRYADSSPDVVLDGPETTAVDEPVNFSAAATTDEDGVDSYRWRIDGDTLLSGPTIRVAFATAGSHDVTLSVTDSEGNTGVETRLITVERTADRPGAVTVTRQNATHATATVEGTGLLQLVRPENGSLAAGEAVALERVGATFPVNRSVSLAVRASDGAPPSLGGHGFGLFELDHDNPASRVHLRFSVDGATLERAGVAPGEVVLYRGGDEWTPLPTTVVRRGDRRVVYQATSPGLSQFAVGAADDGSAPAETAVTVETESVGARAEATAEAPGSGVDARPDIAVTNVSVNATAPRVGDTVAITVTATNRGNADGSYPFSVRLNDSAVATHEIPVAAGETVTRSYAQNLSTAGPLVVAGHSVTNVSDAGGSLLPASVSGLFSGVPNPLALLPDGLPNPLALWPGGVVGTVLGALVGLVVVVYSVLKALAIYLGY